MQKINREELKEALTWIKDQYQKIQNAPKVGGMPLGVAMTNVQDFERHSATILSAAAILLEITDPEFVPSEEMMDNAYGDYKDTEKRYIFRALMMELAE